MTALQLDATTGWSGKRWAAGRIEYGDGAPDGGMKIAAEYHMEMSR